MTPESPDTQLPGASEPAAKARTLREELTSHEMRERYRSQMMSSIGGWSGTVIAAIPTVVFVAVNIPASLRTAVYAAVGSAVVLALYRLARKQSVLQAASGLVGVVIAALIAQGTGEARNFFLIGILTSFAYGLAFLISMLVRRPLIGLLWEFLDPIARHHPTDADVDPLPAADGEPAVDPAVPVAAPASVTSGRELLPHESDAPWYRHKQLLRAYQWATFAGVVLFMTRGVVQTILYLLDETTSLGIVKIAMGYPLWIGAVVFSFWIVRRTRHKLYPPKVEPVA